MGGDDAAAAELRRVEEDEWQWAGRFEIIGTGPLLGTMDHEAPPVTSLTLPRTDSNSTTAKDDGGPGNRRPQPFIPLVRPGY